MANDYKKDLLAAIEGRFGSITRLPGSQSLIELRGGVRVYLRYSKIPQPVAAFVDYDPAGLIIASNLPRLSMIVAPPGHELERLMKKGVRNRYLSQIAGCQGQLDHAADPTIARLWDIIRKSGRALPQEYFVQIR